MGVIVETASFEIDLRFNLFENTIASLDCLDDKSVESAFLRFQLS